MTRPTPVDVCEVGPRDGLQGLPDYVPTARKVRLIQDLIDAGLRTIEVASFVSPRAIPQMRDARDVLAALPRRPDVAFAAFVPNVRGFDAALAAGIHWAGIATYAPEEFSRRNVNATVGESLARIREVVHAAQGTPVRVRGYVSCAIACPFTGPVPPAHVATLAAAVLEAGCAEVCLGDTTGHGTAATVARLLDAVLARVPAHRVGIHFHDTYGQGLANVLTCLQRGIRRVDSSVAGLGGCPTAEGAAGNVATEDLLVLLAGLGLAPAVDTARVAAIGAAFCRELGIRNDSKAGRALAARQASAGRDA